MSCHRTRGHSEIQSSLARNRILREHDIDEVCLSVCIYAHYEEQQDDQTFYLLLTFYALLSSLLTEASEFSISNNTTGAGFPKRWMLFVPKLFPRCIKEPRGGVGFLVCPPYGSAEVLTGPDRLSARMSNSKPYRVNIPPRSRDIHRADSIDCKAAKYLRTSTMSAPSFHRSMMSAHLFSGHLKNHSAEYPSPVVTRQQSIEKYPCANAARPIFVVYPLNAVSTCPNVAVDVTAVLIGRPF